MTNKRTKKEIVDRMEELMRPIDIQIMMCDNINDVLMLASNMLVTARSIYIQNLGGAGAKELFQKMTDEIDDRIFPVGGKVPPNNRS